MGALRLHHATLRNCTYFLDEPGHVTPDGRRRHMKRRVFRLDENGDTIDVTLPKWEALKAAMDAGRIPREWFLLNDVPNPPPLRLDVYGPGSSTGRTFERIVGDIIREIAPGVTQVTVTDPGLYKSPIRKV